MGNHKNAQLIIILLSLGTLLIVSLACDCPPTNPPPKVKPPVHPKPPVHSKPPHVKPPPVAKPPPTVPKSPPKPPPKPPVVMPPTVPKTPPPSPSPPSPSPPSETCPIDTLKLSGCVDVLGGLVQIVIGQSAKDECCPVLEGLVGLDAALCLCTTIKAKLLNINILLPIALQLLVDCGKNPPSGFQCPS